MSTVWVPLHLRVLRFITSFAFITILVRVMMWSMAVHLIVNCGVPPLESFLLGDKIGDLLLERIEQIYPSPKQLT